MHLSSDSAAKVRAISGRAQFPYPLVSSRPTIIGCSTGLVTQHEISKGSLIRVELNADPDYPELSWIVATEIRGIILLEWPRPVGEGKLYFLTYASPYFAALDKLRAKFIRRSTYWRIAFATGITFENAKLVLQQKDNAFGTCAILGVKLAQALTQERGDEATQIILSLGQNTQTAQRDIKLLLPNNPIPPKLHGVPIKTVLQSAIRYCDLAL